MEALKCSCCGGDVRVNADKSIAEMFVLRI